MNLPIETDAVIVGAGPVGIFQAFELGLLEIKAHIIDSLPAPGGQCAELYPQKPIYDIPGIPACTGQELVQNLLEQASVFKPDFHLNELVTEIHQRPDGRYDLKTSRNTHFITRTIFLACGVGAFAPRKIQIEGINQFEERQLFYKIPDETDLSGKNVLVIGGDDSAINACLSLVDKVKSVTLLHRRNILNASAATLEKFTAYCEDNKISFKTGQIVGYRAQAEQLTGIEVLGSDGIETSYALDLLLVFLGLSPKLGPIADWGLQIEHKQVQVDTEKFATNLPGIYAVGDINTYPGKKKLILCGFHEATLAAFGAQTYITPDHQFPLQYTTTSSKLQRLLLK